MFNIYRPQKEPKKTMIMISLIVFLGIVGGIFYNYIVAVSLFFWMHYTIVLSYLQFKHKSKHSYKSMTEILLNPQIRFFIFETLAIMGIIGVLVYDSRQVGVLSLIFWWLFSYNFYRNYAMKRK